jgi:hypothetical protein
LFSTAPVDFGIDTPIAIVPDDLLIEAADLAATPVSQVPADSPALGAVIDLVRIIIKSAQEKNS